MLCFQLPAGDGIETDVLSENVKGNSYVLEYVVTAPENPSRHVLSVFALRPAESVVGLNLQSKEENFSKLKDDFTFVLQNFKFDDESN